VKVEVTPESTTAETITQHLFHVHKNDKRRLLVHLLKSNADMKSVLVFTRTKHGADRVVKDLMKAGETAAAIHGNKSQNARQLALQNFKKGVTRVLVATDIAARGIDIDELGHVINYELPNIPETYVHRIGRTGRAGASGIAFSFCEAEERAYLKDIQKLIGKPIPVINEHPYSGPHANREAEQTEEPVRQPQPRRNEQQQGRQQQRNNQQQQRGNQQRRDNNRKPMQQQRPVQAQQEQEKKTNVAADRQSTPPPPRKKTNKVLSHPVAKTVKEDNFQSSIVAKSSIIFNDEDRW
jgi:ATP-dependent RNA helicase RhlE